MGTGMLQVDVDRDGSCFFHAVHLLLIRLGLRDRSEASGFELRNQLLNWELRHGDDNLAKVYGFQRDGQASSPLAPLPPSPPALFKMNRSSMFCQKRRLP